jgi:hypothetical protein
MNLTPNVSKHKLGARWLVDEYRPGKERQRGGERPSRQELRSEDEHRQKGRRRSDDDRHPSRS